MEIVSKLDLGRTLEANFPQQQSAARRARRSLISMIFPASCVGCDLELDQAVFCEPGPASESRTAPLSHEVDCFNSPAVSAHLNSTAQFQYWQQSHWCEKCWSQLTHHSQRRCRRCGAILTRLNPLGDRCAHCFGHEFRFDGAFAVGNYQGLLQQLVIRMKNQHDEALAMQLGILLGYELIGEGRTEFDRLVPVPAHWSRRLKRGFQAADILAESVSRLTEIPKRVDTVRMTRKTRKQGTLSTTGRLANVRDAFELLPQSEVEGQRIMLVDDVMTSGATASELAQILKRGGAALVSVAVVARGAGVS